MFARASPTDKLAALTALSVLAKRQPVEMALLRDGYLLALEGVTRRSLAEAVREIMQNSLGHAFMPTPPELRGECNRLHALHVEPTVRERRFRWDEDEGPPPPDAKAKAKVAAIYAAVLADRERIRRMQGNAEWAAAALRNGINASTVAGIPDRPSPKA
jgi:hypothetical protein